MRSEAVCTACGKMFVADTSTAQPVCPECQATAVHDPPTSPREPAPNETLDERLRRLFPPELDSALSSTPRERQASATGFGSSVPVIVVCLLCALVVLLVIFCYIPWVMEQVT